MKKLFLVFLTLTVSLYGKTQSLELSISNPQPRVGDDFYLSVDISDLKSELFKSLSNKVQISTDYITGDNGQLKIKITASNKGIAELGPLSFSLNGTTYSTNKVTYEVIDELPQVDNGLWIRKVRKDETTFYLIIEQRIPAKIVTAKNDDNSITTSTEPETEEFVKINSDYSIEGLSTDFSSTSSDYSSFVETGIRKHYMNCFSFYTFKIEDKTQKIVLSRDLFENLPKTYKFEEIKVQ